MTHRPAHSRRLWSDPSSPHTRTCHPWRSKRIGLLGSTCSVEKDNVILTSEAETHGRPAQGAGVGNAACKHPMGVGSSENPERQAASVFWGENTPSLRLGREFRDAGHWREEILGFTS